jgi:glycosyltransferase involved in cell wall biosynthesis
VTLDRANGVLESEPTRGLVSVVIPTLNGGRYLREAIASVIAQTYHRIEIIVVDDGSEDDTRRICDEFGRRVTYIHRDNDGTMGAGARNRGLSEATGELVALLDHDDRWLPDKIERQVAAMRSDPRVGVVFTGTAIIDGDGRVMPTEFGVAELPMVAGDVFHDLLKGNRYCVSSALVRSDVLRDVGVPGDHVNPHDYALWLRIARRYRVDVVPERLTEYRVHAAAYSANALRMATETRRLIETLRPLLHPDCPQCTKLLRDAISRSYLNEFHHTARRGHLIQSLPFLFQAWRTLSVFPWRPRRLAAIARSLTLSARQRVQ